MIYVTLGTMHLGFDRLVNAMDAIARETGERTVVQTGLSKAFPAHCEHFDFKPREEALDVQRQARVIVAHAGIGSIIDALLVGKPLVVVPRLREFHEHNNDHQLDLARAVERRGWGRVIFDVAELPEACARPPAAHTHYIPDKLRLIGAVREAILNSALSASARRR